MTNDANYFRRQAALQLEHASQEPLANVRERCTRAAATWTAMANQADRFEQLKKQRAGGIDASGAGTPADTGE